MECRCFVPGDLSAVIGMFASAFGQTEGEADGFRIGGLVNDLVQSTNAADWYGLVQQKNDLLM